MPTFDFGKGEVTCRRHNFGTGLIAPTALAEGTVSIGANSAVGENARVRGHVSLIGTTIVRGNVEIKGKEIRLEDCEIEGDSEMEGWVYLKNVRVKGKTRIKGEVSIQGPVIICGNATLEGSLRIHNSTQESIIIDMTPIVLEGIVKVPLIIIPSPKMLLLVGLDCICSLESPLDINDTVSKVMEKLGISRSKLDLILLLINNATVIAVDQNIFTKPVTPSKN